MSNVSIFLRIGQFRHYISCKDILSNLYYPCNQNCISNERMHSSISSAKPIPGGWSTQAKLGEIFLTLRGRSGGEKKISESHFKALKFSAKSDTIANRKAASDVTSTRGSHGKNCYQQSLPTQTPNQLKFSILRLLIVPESAQRCNGRSMILWQKEMPQATARSARKPLSGTEKTMYSGKHGILSEPIPVLASRFSAASAAKRRKK